MSKMSELSQILDEMISAGNSMVNAAESLKAFYSNEEKCETAKEEEPIKVYSKEDVRLLLADKANEQDGKYKVSVKALVAKYANGGTLKNIQPEQYPSLVSEMEALDG